MAKRQSHKFRGSRETVRDENAVGAACLPPSGFRIRLSLLWKGAGGVKAACSTPFKQDTRHSPRGINHPTPTRDGTGLHKTTHIIPLPGITKFAFEVPAKDFVYVAGKSGCEMGQDPYRVFFGCFAEKGKTSDCSGLREEG